MILNAKLKFFPIAGHQLKLTHMGKRIFADMRESKVEYTRLFDHMYSKAWLAEIRLQEGEGIEKEAEDVENVEGGNIEVENIEGGDMENVERVEHREELPEIIEAEKKALNGRRMKRRHERQTPSGVQIRRQQSVDIHARKKIMSKSKGIDLESKHDRPKKKHKPSQQVLDEDILNMLSEATKNETSLLKAEVMAFRDREDDRERDYRA
ncbi:hypothetical protein L1987_42488 [Smallanthus sonchifolius]|uniref:Uncharacterized protein n=1 Tax=Smallanthus sonchifolius TaxID=185202 RepID=A0ACB9GJ25_9ASTR|nr:hypothetical protein L1987_42488 [Smallanthus sonchifolius]